MTALTETSLPVLFAVVFFLEPVTVRSAGLDPASCNPNVTEGQPSTMTFHFGRAIDKKSDGFFIYMRRKADLETDLLRCERPNPASSVACKSLNNSFTFHSIKSENITVKVPSTTKDLEDTYTLQVYEKSSPLPLINCTITVKKRDLDPSDPNGDENNAWIAAPVVLLLAGVIAIAAFIYFCYLRKRKDNGESTESRWPLINRHFRRNKDRNEHKRKRWFHENLMEEIENKLLQSDRTKEGSFLVTVGSTNPNHLLLAVYFSGVLKRFPISREKNGFRLLDTEEFFRTVPLLVNHYKNHDIRVGDTVWGRLSKPFRVEPEEDWYFGKFTREDEKKVLQTSAKKTGSFLIRDGTTDPDDYVLAVCFDANMKHFTIIEEDEGFYFRDTDTHFATLTELVDNYKEQPIIVGERNYGTLSTPFEKMRLDQWYLETFTARDDNKFLSSSRKKAGSFLVTVGTTNPNHYILAVFFEGTVKRFPISREGHGYELVNTHRAFRTLPELLNYYKAHDIKDGEKVWGKLTNHFRLEPEENWYFGKFTREDEDKLLQTGKHGPGTFLIRDGVTDPDNYVLAVFCDGKINHFTIIQEENGFKLRDTGTVHRSLDDLVSYYKENVITVGGKHYCKLSKPFQK